METHIHWKERGWFLRNSVQLDADNAKELIQSTL
jgi:hypothetical protein